MLFHVIVVFLDVHEITAITKDREEGNRDGVSGVLVLDVLEEAENRGGRGAREKPRGYAGGAELKRVQLSFSALSFAGCTFWWVGSLPAQLWPSPQLHPSLAWAAGLGGRRRRSPGSRYDLFPRYDPCYDLCSHRGFSPCFPDPPGPPKPLPLPPVL